MDLVPFPTSILSPFVGNICCSFLTRINSPFFFSSPVPPPPNPLSFSFGSQGISIVCLCRLNRQTPTFLDPGYTYDPRLAKQHVLSVPCSLRWTWPTFQGKPMRISAGCIRIARLGGYGPGDRGTAEERSQSRDGDRESQGDP